jgi:hypothetical protein
MIQGKGEDLKKIAIIKNTIYQTQRRAKKWDTKFLVY